MTDFQSEELDYDRDGNRTRDLRHHCTTTPIVNQHILQRFLIFKGIKNESLESEI